MLNPITTRTHEIMLDLLDQIEDRFGADCIYINGPIGDELVSFARETIKALRTDRNNDTLYILLTTNGGDAITVERLVNVFRHNYSEVNFIIPDHAYSAGTILCMSGDNILMDYNSVLGPIDPQVMNKEGRFVPALGYLEKINALLEKAENDTISQAEFLILKDFDLAELSSFEQARDLTTVLLKSWLVKYKFKNWKTHKTTGTPVTEEEKEARATYIAQELSNYDRWKSHGRPLDIETVRSLGLKITDFGNDSDLQDLIWEFHSLCEDYMKLQDTVGFIFSRRM